MGGEGGGVLRIGGGGVPWMKGGREMDTKVGTDY
jgi:hypothetical protein